MQARDVCVSPEQHSRNMTHDNFISAIQVEIRRELSRSAWEVITFLHRRKENRRLREEISYYRLVRGIRTFLHSSALVIISVFDYRLIRRFRRSNWTVLVSIRVNLREQEVDQLPGGNAGAATPNGINGVGMISDAWWLNLI